MSDAAAPRQQHEQPYIQVNISLGLEISDSCRNPSKYSHVYISVEISQYHAWGIYSLVTARDLSSLFQSSVLRMDVG